MFNIKKVRTSKNILQEELASNSGISQEYISKLESDQKTNPSLDTLRKIADALGVTVGDLVDPIPEEPKPDDTP